MLSRNTLAIASTIAIACSIAAIALAQETFKSAKFLTYPAESQKSYINSSVMMALLIAGRNSQEQSKCIGDWSGSHFEGGYRPVVEAMGRFPDHHPSAVILAVLQKACGSFEYRKR